MNNRKLKKYSKLITSVVVSLVMVITLGFVAIQNGWGISASGHTLADQHGRPIDGNEVVRIARETWDTARRNGHPEYTWGGVSAYYNAGQNDTIHGTGYHPGYDCSGFVSAVYMKYFGYTDNLDPATGPTHYYKDPTGAPIGAMTPLTYLGYVSGYGDLGTVGWDAMFKNWHISNSGKVPLGQDVSANYQPGDIIMFYATNGSPKHMGIYSGNGNIIHSTYDPNKGWDGLVETKLSDVTKTLYKTYDGYTIYETVTRVTRESNLTMRKVDRTTGKGAGQGGATLAGAEYTLKDADGKTVHTFVMNENGETDTANGLPLGTYTLQETKAPTGYNIDPNVDTINLQNESGAVITKEYSDEVQTGQVKIHKYISAEDEANNSPENCEPEAGAVFEIISTKYLKGKTPQEVIAQIASNQLSVGANEYSKMVTDSKGEATSGPLAYGTYKMIQTKSSDNTHITTQVFDVDITEAIKNGKTLEYTVYNEPVTHLDFSKTDIAGAEIPGAKMQILDSEGKVVEEWTSTDTPHIVRDLKQGKYKLHEDLAPLGYVKAQDVDFVVANNYKAQKVNMVDKIVTISKKDVGGEEVPGAKIQVFDEDDNVVDEWVSTEEPHQVKNLEVGKTYRMHEEVAPKGYTVATDIEFTVGADDVNEHYDLVDKRVGIVKMAENSKDSYPLTGARMSIIDKDKEVVDSWVSDAKDAHYANNLVVGETYTLHEDEAPDGYIRAQDVQFTVEDNLADQTVTMIDPELLVHKVDDFNKRVVGAGMAIVDVKTGKTVDSWTTYDKVVNLTEAQTKQLESGEGLVVDSNIVLTDDTQKQLEGYYSKLVELGQNLTVEETLGYDYKAEFDSIRAGLDELLNKNVEKPVEEVEDKTETTETTEEANETTETTEDTEDEEVEITDADKAKLAYNQYLDKLEQSLSKMQKAETAEEAGKIYNDSYMQDLIDLHSTFKESVRVGQNGVMDSEIVVSIGEDGNQKYDLITQTRDEKDESKVITHYVRIDRKGYEYAHRARNLEAGKTYKVMEVKTPDGYATAKEFEFVADPELKTLTIQMVDSILLIPSGPHTGVELSVHNLFIALGAVAGIAVLYGGYVIIKKIRKKKNK